MIINKRKNSAYKVAFLGLMLALATALAFFESLLPVLPFLPPGVKLGLSNIVTMYCLFFAGFPAAIMVAVLKACFVLLTRGPVAFAMSLAGGAFSVLIMQGFKKLPGVNNYMLSIIGALGHNIGQIIMSCVILKTFYAIYYLPVLLISGIMMGCLTGYLLRLLMPYLTSLEKALK